MKKYFLISLLVAIIPGIAFGASAKYTQLVREKQRKMEQLEKCMGSSKGLQIAGLSTLGLTAVGVAGNIYEAKLIKENDKTIEKKDKKITEKQTEFDDKQKAYDDAKANTEVAEKKKAEALARAKAKCDNKDFYEWQNDECVLVKAKDECESRKGQYDETKKSCLCGEQVMGTYERCSKGSAVLDQKLINELAADKVTEYEMPDYEIDIEPKSVDFHEASEDENRCNELQGTWVNDSCTGLDNSKLSQEDACWYEGGIWWGTRCDCPSGDGEFNPETKTCDPVTAIPVAIQSLTVVEKKPEVKNIPVHSNGNLGTPFASVENNSYVLAQPVEEQPAVVLPDRSATSYFKRP